jgi:hypothetical protein
MFKGMADINDTIGYDTQVKIKIYENIQDGVAQGFSFSSTRKVDTTKQDYYVEIILNIIIFVSTYVVLHAIFFVLM